MAGATENPIEHLVWDSQFWNCRVCRLHIDAHVGTDDRFDSILAEACHEFDFVQILLPAERIRQVQRAEQAGFLLVDLRCELSLESDQFVSVASTSTSRIRRAEDTELEEVAELASTCHDRTRFGSDLGLDPGRVAELYRRWIRRDVSRPDWKVGVADGDRGIEGYISYGPATTGVSTVGLVGVAPLARGSRLGTNLVAHAIAESLVFGSMRVDVVTQGGSNAALAMYQHLGFRISKLGYWMHWHDGQNGTHR